MNQAELQQALPEAQRKHLDPASPGPARMMAARGLVPLRPRELVIVLAGLALDADAAIADAARGSLAKMPDKVLGAALGGGLPTPALEPLARALVGRDHPLEQIVVSRDTPDGVVALVAETASEKVAEIIAGDQQRLVRAPEIIAALKANPAALKSSIDRIFDFLVRSGIIFDQFPEAAEALSRLSSTDFEQAAQKVDLPPEVSELIDNASAPPADTKVEDAQTDVAKAEGDQPDGTKTDEAKAQDAKAAELEKTLEANMPAEEKAARVPMLKLVATLNVAQKVALAIRGNREARSLLVRDSNKMVAVAAIRSPRITEQEVRAVASSRTVHDDVIRIICSSREMTRSYAVKLALAGNPKTPLQVAMKFLPLLRESDVKIMSKSKSVPNAIAMQARRMMQNRQSGGSKE